MKSFVRFIFISWVCFASSIYAQTVYRTPSGGKYHTEHCRYVKNVSHALSVAQAQQMGLDACKQCKPMAQLSGNSMRLISSASGGIKANEAKGTGSTVQCKGKTKAGSRCKRTTRNTNGYCFQHES